MNIGATYRTGPTEAAYVVNGMVKSNTVIASHANEATTKKGILLPNTETDIFMKASQTTVHIPLSGNTMSFNEKGTCIYGCLLI